jgi:hypothetical protein
MIKWLWQMKGMSQDIVLLYQWKKKERNRMNVKNPSKTLFYLKYGKFWEELKARGKIHGIQTRKESEMSSALKGGDSMNNLIDSYVHDDQDNNLSNHNNFERLTEVPRKTRTSKSSATEQQIDINHHFPTIPLSSAHEPIQLKRLSNPSTPNKPKGMLNKLIKGLASMQSFHGSTTGLSTPKLEPQKSPLKKQLTRQNTSQLLNSFSVFADVAGMSVEPMKRSESLAMMKSTQDTDGEFKGNLPKNNFSKSGSLSVLNKEKYDFLSGGPSSSSILLKEEKNGAIEKSNSKSMNDLTSINAKEEQISGRIFRPKTPSNQSNGSNTERKNAWEKVLNSIVMRGSAPSIDEEKISDETFDVLSDVMAAIKSGEIKIDPKKKRIASSETKILQHVILSSINRLNSNEVKFPTDSSSLNQLVKRIGDLVHRQMINSSSMVSR